jgi:hypothetical protein
MIKDLLNKNYEIILKENYLDIKYYSRILGTNENKIEIIIDNKKLIIIGSCLCIKCMDQYEIVIKGSISSIKLIDE